MSQRIRIENKLPQAVTVSVLDEQGNAVALRLSPHGSSDPLPLASLTDHTYALIERGYVKMRVVP